MTVTSLPVLPAGVDTPEPISGPVLGHRKAFVLLVEFPDNRADRTDHSPAAFQKLLFDASGAIPTGSMREYYQEVSYGKLSLSGTVSVWIEAPRTNAFYADSEFGQGRWPRNSMRLAWDAVVATDPFVDFSLYDGDGDGNVDGLFIVHAGPGGEETGNENDLWSHKGTMPADGCGLGDGYLTDDGVIIPAYTLQPEEDQEGRLVDIGVFCHEYGHVLGWPDLYDRDYSSVGIGNWCLMATGSWGGDGHSPETPVHPCAWLKEQVGWIELTVIQQNENGVRIDRVEDHDEVLKLYAEGNLPVEYFLLENRAKIGFDRNLPGSGLLIWHVDQSVSTQNDDELRKLVDLEEADDAEDIDRGTNHGDAGDPFPGSRGNRVFDFFSSPGSARYDGRPSEVSVFNIDHSGSVVTADMHVGDFLTEIAEETSDPSGPAVYELRQNFPNPFNLSTAISFALPVQSNESGVKRKDGTLDSQPLTPHVSLKVFNTLGQEVRTLLDQPMPAGAYTATWDGTDGSGRPLPSGVYFYRLEAGQFHPTRGMVLLK